MPLRRPGGLDAIARCRSQQGAIERQAEAFHENLPHDGFDVRGRVLKQLAGKNRDRGELPGVKRRRARQELTDRDRVALGNEACAIVVGDDLRDLDHGIVGKRQHNAARQQLRTGRDRAETGQEIGGQSPQKARGRRGRRGGRRGLDEPVAVAVVRPFFLREVGRIALSIGVLKWLTTARVKDFNTPLRTASRSGRKGTGVRAFMP